MVVKSFFSILGKKEDGKWSRQILTAQCNSLSWGHPIIFRPICPLDELFPIQNPIQRSGLKPGKNHQKIEKRKLDLRMCSVSRDIWQYKKSTVPKMRLTTNLAQKTKWHLWPCPGGGGADK